MIMKILLESILFLSLFGLLHSYVFYPLLLRMLAVGKKPNDLIFSKEEDFPRVSVIMAVYNEEKVIAEKLDSLLHLDYPRDRLLIFIGSDRSSDRTNEIVGQYAGKHGIIHFSPYEERRGKPGVINQLTEEALNRYPESADHIFLITDANVILTPLTLRNLARHFRNERIVIVDAHMVHTGMQDEGISHAENRYISSEVKLKYLEGIVWGKMIGPFGGCYAIRSDYFSKVPATFLVDDFYITMKAFERGGEAINDLDAICYESVSHEIREEFRRKARISGGNFQNLLTFKHLWWPPVRPVSFAFFSHKVLRWMGPFFLIGMVVAAAILGYGGNLFYRLLFLFLIVIFALLPLLDYLLKNFNIHLLPARALRYFVIMNVALLAGFLKFLNGIQNNVWEPPKRN